MKSKYTYRIFVGVLLILIFGLLKGPSLIVYRTAIPCADYFNMRDLTPGLTETSCFKNYNVFAMPWRTLLISNKSVDTPARIKIDTRNPNDFELFGQSLNAPNVIAFDRSDGADPTFAHARGFGTSWSSAVREKIQLPQDIGSDLIIVASPNTKQYEISWLPTIIAPDQWKFLTGIALLFGVALVVLLFDAISTSEFFLVLTGSFALLTVYCGLPFWAVVGNYDPGDDKSYVHWTYNLGYLLDPNLYHSNLGSWAQLYNHHPWGTGLLLAPFVWPIRLLRPGLGLGTMQLAAMSFGVYVLSFLAIVVLFLGFRRVFNDRIAAFCAFLTVVCTSLLKWIYLRNMFSHGPESFVLAVAAYGFIGRFFTRDQKKSDLHLMLVGLFMAHQTRLENLMLFALPISYEILVSNSTRRDRIVGMVSCIGTAGLSLLVLQSTNYFTNQRSFWGLHTQGSLFHLHQIIPMIQKNFWDVLVSESFGLFYWKNAFSWLALYALVKGIRHWRIWLPLVGMVSGYLFMCMIFEYPNGMEWQNRFLLKLNPILFGACAYALSQSGKKARVFMVTLLAVSSALEVAAYQSQVAGGTAYFDTLTDGTWLFPQTFPGGMMSLFFLPVVAFLGATLVLIFWNGRSRAS